MEDETVDSKSILPPDQNGDRNLCFTVTVGEAGERLDRVVTARCPQLSRTRVKELIDCGLVQVNGAASKGSRHVHAGEKIEVQPQARPPLHAQPEAIPIEILYEDADILAVNKAAGMTVHAGAGTSTGTLVNALLGRGLSLSQGGDALRPGIVHRLDKETSGVILIAKNDAAHARLGEAFRGRTVKKTYLALAQGHFEQRSGRIELPIGRDPLRRVRMATQQKSWHGAKIVNPREARTDWRVLATVATATLLEVLLHTGRTHQIRVHLAALKHPVAGDTLYGAAAQLRVGNVTLAPLGRNFLHAAKIRFAHPRTGQTLELRSPLPPELRAYLQALAHAAHEDPVKIDAALAPYL